VRTSAARPAHLFGPVLESEGAFEPEPLPGTAAPTLAVADDESEEDPQQAPTVEDDPQPLSIWQRHFTVYCENVRARFDGLALLHVDRFREAFSELARIRAAFP